MAETGSPIGVERQQRNRALVRLVPGELQIISRTAGFLLLVTTGPSRETVTVTIVTLLVSMVSWIIFRPKRSAAQSGPGNAAHRK